MAPSLRLHIFGDQLLDVGPLFRQLDGKREDPILERLLLRTFEAIRGEIDLLPHETKSLLPRFSSIDDIIFRRPGEKSCIALDMAITCLYQTAAFVVQQQHRSSTHSLGSLGLCTGSLAAAVVSCCRTTLDIVPLAAHAVRVAFRIGICVAETAARIENPATIDQSWLLLVSGPQSAESALQEYCEGSQLPNVRLPFVSARTPNCVMISGPPSILDDLTRSPVFKGLKVQRAPIHGPYHAPHLYSPDQAADIAASARDLKIEAFARQSVIFSGDGHVTEGPDFGACITAAVEQILRRPICWDSILGQLLEHLKNTQQASLEVTTIGTKAEHAVFNALQRSEIGAYIHSTPNESNSTELPHHQELDGGRRKLAIVGISGRFPGADDVEAFWKLLEEGLDVHKPVPELRWPAESHVDGSGSRKNTSATPFGCWLDSADMFDSKFFNISPREAAQIDPAQRLAMMTAFEAIEQAGMVPDSTPSTRRDRVGVYYGCTSNDWMETNSAQDISTYFIPGGNRAFIPGRINYYFKFSGPSYAVDTACSSSLASIHLACNALWRREIDTAIAGGTNVLTNPDFTAGLDRGHFLSRTGNCKTFDDSADGYCRGEGVGTVVIKRLDDAIKDNDPIRAVILGASTNHSSESDSITRPHAGAQRDIMGGILNSAAVEPGDVSYVEMHGTGTQFGDAGEMTSVLNTFAPSPSGQSRSRGQHNPIFLGSAKANIGHGEAASGVSSLVKVLLMMEKDTIVPHCGIKTQINRRFPTDLDDRNVRIAQAPVPWRRSENASSKPRRVLVNNFSAAGGNSALLLEDAPLQWSEEHRDKELCHHHLISVSAKSPASFHGNLHSMLRYLDACPHVSLGKLSYTTTARRTHHQHRVMASGSKVEDIVSQLRACLDSGTGTTRPKNKPEIMFAYAGQGALYPGMGRELSYRFSVFRDEVMRLDQLAQSMSFPSVLSVIDSDAKDTDDLEPMAVQLAGVCVQMALGKLWRSWNVVPAAVVGHSLGEYSALNAAGVLTDADTLFLVGTRARLLQDKCTQGSHSMLVVKGSLDDVTEALQGKHYEVACINSPVETVLAASNEDLKRVKESLALVGFKSTPLQVPYAFHSAQVDPILPDFRSLASAVAFSPPKTPILSPLDIAVYHGEETGFSPDYLVRHTREPVNMDKALRLASRRNLVTDRTTALEVGAHPALSGMLKAVLGPQINCLASLSRGRPHDQVLNASLKSLYMSGSDIRWQQFHADSQEWHEVLPLPAYSWDLKSYWIQYVNDWSLRKGDAPPPASDAPKLESTTIHRVVEEKVSASGASLVVEANIAREDLSPLVQGHEVDGIPLCTPSVYADMALTLGEHLLQHYLPIRSEKMVDVAEMTVSKALILRQGASSQLLQAHCDASWETNTATIKFMSFDSREKLQQHAQCIIRFQDQSFRQAMESNAADSLQKTKALREGIAAGTAARFTKPMVYRAIRPLAIFHADYRAIQEILLNSDTLEACCKLDFHDVKKGGSYHTHPAVIDCLTQVCGFAMNCNDYTDLDKDAFMNHGWDSFVAFEPLSMNQAYTTYTHMREGSDRLWRGDVVVRNVDGKVAAYFGGIAIQGVQRRVLKTVLSVESGSKTAKKQQTAQTAQPPEVDSIVRSVGGRKTADRPSSRMPQALNIIAEESGLALADFTESTNFTDVGIDSLLNLTISARLKDQLDTDIGFSGLVSDYPTVASLRELLDPRSGEPSIEPPTSVEAALGPSSNAASEQASQAGELDFRRVLDIISEESGVAANDFADDTEFADAGIDSLLSLVIVGRLRDELELEIQHESLLTECPTILDLKRTLLGEPVEAKNSSQRTTDLEKPSDDTGDSSMSRHDSASPERHDPASASLDRRRKAVAEMVQKYAADFSGPGASAAPSTGSPSKVVLITGGSGSLGGHLVDQLAQRTDVDKVICLNRIKPNTDAYAHQQKAMRDHGIRSFDKIRPKLLVLQSDTAKPMLGLPHATFQELVNSVTGLIHNAWPMSAKRALEGFEPQFQVMRNLIDFASAAASRMPRSAKFGFEMVSSIGVVGHYGRFDAASLDVMSVPEERVDIDSVLPNGYGEAKWGCERMLDETLHRDGSDRIRTMAVRLGQIAGSKRCGYWNPTEHFGFLVKSSQTLDALPDAPGKAYWTPVEDVAGTLIDLVLADNTPCPIYHVENPVGQNWGGLTRLLANTLQIESLVPFAEWVKRVRSAPHRDNPAATLVDFFDDNYLRMSCGGLVMDTAKARGHSETLARVGPVGEAVVRKYVHVWKEIGFLR